MAKKRRRKKKEFVFPQWDAMLQQFDKASKSQLQISRKRDKQIAVKQLGDRRRLALIGVCEDGENCAALQFQTKINGKWAPIVTMSTDKESHYIDLVSKDTIQQVLAVKPYRFVKPFLDDLSMLYDDAIATQAPRRRMGFCGFVTIDPETFEVKPAYKGEALALIWVYTDDGEDYDSSAIGVSKDKWWPISMNAHLEGIVEDRSKLEAGLRGAHVEMAWMPWGYFDEFPEPEWEPINRQIKLTEADQVHVKRLLEMLQTDPDSWWDGYDYPTVD